MSKNQHSFQNWIEENGIVDVRFYPTNPTTSSGTEMLDSAMDAINRYKSGECVDYEDNVPESFI